MLSQQIVRKRLLDDKENEIDKVSFLRRHFSFPENINKQTKHEIYKYYQEADPVLGLDYFALLMLKPIILTCSQIEQWNFVVNTAVNRSTMLSIDQKLSLIRTEYNSGNRKVLRGISRSFFACLTDSEFEPFKSVYAHESPKRLGEIISAREQLIPSPKQETSYIPTQEVAVCPEVPFLIPDPLPHSSSSTDSITPAPEMGHCSDLESASTTIGLCTGLCTLVGAIAGAVVGGPIGAVVFGAIGFAVGMLVGATINIIRRNMAKQSQLNRPPSPIYMASITPTPPATPVLVARAETSINNDPPKSALSFFGWVRQKVCPQAGLEHAQQ